VEDVAKRGEKTAVTVFRFEMDDEAETEKAFTAEGVEMRWKQM